MIPRQVPNNVLDVCMMPVEAIVDILRSTQSLSDIQPDVLVAMLGRPGLSEAMKDFLPTGISVWAYEADYAIKKAAEAGCELKLDKPTGAMEAHCSIIDYKPIRGSNGKRSDCTEEM